MPAGGGGFPDFFGMSDRTRVVGSDGITALHEALRGTEGIILAHIDPYDPWAAGPSGLSALGLAREFISLRVRVIYWYGYSNPKRRSWAFDALAQSDSSLPIWYGDVMIGSYEVEMTGETSAWPRRRAPAWHRRRALLGRSNQRLSAPR